ncbi:MAG: hypothetical protein HPY51_14000 [Candidatus Omnitrophica bacterium]|nr:hypothetical protein [Candidatus Omnitrophota bacterium]
MTWTLFRWVWRLEAPLFVGMPPAGALNRCRLYVPARALWGSVTAELSRLKNDKDFPDYCEFGKEFASNCRFTYLYPAEERNNKVLAWMPKFEKSSGLRWFSNGDGGLSDREFRRRLLDSRPGTAIAPESDSASEGSLRETECINPWWRDSNCRGEPNAVLLLGYVFLRDNDFRNQLDDIDTLFVGGDIRYGLGKIRRVGWHEVAGDLSVFGKQVHLDGEHPEILSDVIWGHASEGDQHQFQGIQGVKELLAGWDQGSLRKGALAWVPGSCLELPVDWTIDFDGCWKEARKQNG